MAREPPTFTTVQTAGWVFNWNDCDSWVDLNCSPLTRPTNDAEKIKLSPFVLTVHKGFKSRVLWTAAATIRCLAAVRSRFSDRMERFLRLFNSGLQLSESENLEVVIRDTATKRPRVSKFFLVGKVLTHKYLRPNIVMGVIKDHWRPKGSVEATVIGDNRILFSFNSEEKLRPVLKGSPCFFGKSLLLLAEVNKL
ncbi:hypothetical protein ACFX11_032504 [Malus domestica]